MLQNDREFMKIIRFYDWIQTGKVTHALYRRMRSLELLADSQLFQKLPLAMKDINKLITRRVGCLLYIKTWNIYENQRFIDSIPYTPIKHVISLWLGFKTTR